MRFHVCIEKVVLGFAQAVYAEGKEHALAVGQMKMSTTDVYVKSDLHIPRIAYQLASYDLPVSAVASR